MSNDEKYKNDNIESSKKQRIKTPKPISSVKQKEVDMVISRHNKGFNENQIAAQLMIQKSRVIEILTSRNE